MTASGFVDMLAQLGVERSKSRHTAERVPAQARLPSSPDRSSSV
ncbi:MAG TPA: hypothetical protein VI299_04195 [Polyangiales bacterium]